ncbi:MAG: NADH:ubiquinone oxidoreductase subunit J [Sneathiella sp.]|jgi:NADH-quinone oxidoreductase subunit J|uniref:NADH-quinone oxidoreductase subunit J n=1 Tax=Sneathiella sp. TaxID=1964365 RepID=UPI000C5F1550|nr:NADH-quinone oxidoreductase subunit J [Sneathiella sp.]MAL79726.1 NADH:ubiquinone oxidoreductase subunit J [Sneathiella sp.]|tara:strand:+ start:560 stop:1174 length:615 start_codon:yes stop_codon:yes gene_type:complete
MIISTLAFYLFAGMTVASAFMVIAAKNPVHSVLYLILAFFNSAALFVLLGAEFIAMILVVVYVGAVAVLFLFVVMMLDINFTELRQGFLQYLPIGALVGIILLIELILVLSGWVLSPESLSIAAQVAPVTSDLTNTEQLGHIIYTDYAYLFQAAGMVLLVAMIGAIVLTHRQRPGVRKQNIAKQVYRRPEESVAIRKVEPGQGV